MQSSQRDILWSEDHTRYSLTVKDQSHEHSNKEIKTDGGYTNLNVNDPITLLIQTLASPQLISKFQEEC